MKRIFGILVVYFFIVSLAWGGVPGDVNGDDEIGIPEAIHALQMSSGIRPQGVATRYDFAEYFYKPGTYEYSFKVSTIAPLTSERQEYTVQGLVNVEEETVNEQTYTVYNGTEYYLINSAGVFYSGSKDLSTGERMWSSKPELQGSRSMAPEDFFVNLYEELGNRLYSEITFLGTEDVTTPAGTFTDCLKILRKSHTEREFSVRISYFARGIVRIKSELFIIPYSASWNSQTFELASAKIGTSVIPSDVVYYQGEGTWTDGSRSGPFTFSLTLGKLPAGGKLTLKDYNPPPHPTPDYSITLVSDNGSDFSASWNPNYPPDLCNIAVEGGEINGTCLPTMTLSGTYSGRLDFFMRGGAAPQLKMPPEA